ncbi:MFS transporter [Nonomuraea sp. NN258]|uniref:MFS transporter n=1 Tax=Nonomuraea antri TaxID=2730852 RepID=UPI001569810C|nr:MFS transporter [Nonomuraea antri]NRQ31843.1 MFS transporter [Nonomuraea antri]
MAAIFLTTCVLSSVGPLAAGDLPVADAELDPSTADARQLAATAFTLGLVAGGPLVTLVSARLGRRPLLLLAVAATALVIVLPAFLAGTTVLVATAAAVGSLYGLAFGVACGLAASMATAAWAGRAVSVAFAGIAAGAMLGPVTQAWLSELFLSSSLLILAGAVLIVIVLPLLLLVPSPTAVRRERGGTVRGIFRPRALALLGLGALLLGGQPTMVTSGLDLGAWIQALSSSQLIALVAGFAGVAVVLTVAGGWAADRGTLGAMLAANTVLVLSPALLFFMDGGATAVAVVAVWVLAHHALQAPILLGLIKVAGPAGYLAAPVLLSAVHLGSVAGSSLVGRISEFGGSPLVMLSALAVGLVAFPLMAAARQAKAPAEAGHPR